MPAILKIADKRVEQAIPGSSEGAFAHLDSSRTRRGFGFLPSTTDQPRQAPALAPKKWLHDRLLDGLEI